MRTVVATKRLWLPFLAGALCLLATRWTGPVLTWVAMLAAMAFILDGATLLFSRGGGMSGHRQ